MPPPHMRGVSGLNFSVVQLLFRSERMGRGALELFTLCPCEPGILQILLLCVIRATSSSESLRSKVVSCCRLPSVAARYLHAFFGSVRREPKTD